MNESIADLVNLLKETELMFTIIPLHDASTKYRYMYCLEAFLALEHILNDHQLRSWLKHGGIEEQLMTEDEETGKKRPMTSVEAVYWMRDRLWDRFAERGIDLDTALE